MKDFKIVIQNNQTKMKQKENQPFANFSQKTKKEKEKKIHTDLQTCTLYHLLEGFVPFILLYSADIFCAVLYFGSYPPDIYYKRYYN